MRTKTIIECAFKRRGGVVVASVGKHQLPNEVVLIHCFCYSELSFIHIWMTRIMEMTLEWLTRVRYGFIVWLLTRVSFIILLAIKIPMQYNMENNTKFVMV